MARDFGVSPSVIFGVFSGALLLSALLGPWVGGAIDRYGGRPVLVASSIVFAAGLALLGIAPSVAVVCLAWAFLGVGMSLGLYDTAFAALAGLYGRHARGAITGITLMAGFASTVGWPLTASMTHGFGWRGACLVWAGLHLLVGLPLTLAIPEAPGGRARHSNVELVSDPPPRWAMPALAYTFAATWFVTGSMAAHLPGLLVACGASPAAAVAAASLVGPAQVAARIAEWGFLRRAHPLVSARLATIAHPLGALAIAVAGAPAIWTFSLLHGAGNGILTIAKGTVPLAVFGSHGYGVRQGILSAPSRLVQAAAPFLFGLVLERFGAHALLLSTGLSLSALAALAFLRAAPSEASSAVPAEA